jgi:endonuclease/exonuclease/phosphatase family metal-dependent hydrolase
VKLVQLNAWGGRLEHLIEDFLETEKPDLLCLQEIISFSAAQRSGLFVTLELIQRQYDLQHEAFGPVFSFDYMNGTAKFGNAVLSRLPITKNETIFTHMEHTEKFVWGDPGNNARNFVHAEIQVKGQICHVITHHGYWVRDHKNGSKETMEQIQQIADYIEGLSGPVILTGDFNLVPGSKSLEPLNKMLRNLSTEFKLNTTRNQLTHKNEVCDYIFVNDKVQVKQFEASDALISDHKALILDFEI